MKRPLKIHIVGGGVSGLLTAFYLARNRNEIIVSEQSRLGGMISTLQTEFGLIESAANSLMRTNLVDELFRELNIPLLSAKDTSKKRYIALESPRQLPMGFLDTLSTGANFLFHKVSKKHLAFPNELLSDWGQRVLSKTAEENLIRPAIRGIYGKDSRSLSASLVINPLLQKSHTRQKRRGSVSPEQGMQSLIDGLVRHLKASGVRFENERVFTKPDADVVVLAGSLQQKKELLTTLSPAIYQSLIKTQSVSLSSLTQFFDETPDPYPGFGILFHPDHDWKASGLIMNHHVFDNRTKSGFCSLTWIFEGSNLNELEALQISEMNRNRLGYKAQNPRASHFYKWNKAIPLYDAELEQFLKIQTTDPSLRLIGNDQGEIGLAGIIEKAKSLAEGISL